MYSAGQRLAVQAPISQSSSRPEHVGAADRPSSVAPQLHRPVYGSATIRPELAGKRYGVRQDLFLCPAVVRRFSIRVAPGQAPAV
jgi:hypothetical protein